MILEEMHKRDPTDELFLLEEVGVRVLGGFMQLKAQSLELESVKPSFFSYNHVVLDI